MVERVSIPCPNCGRILLIPHQILGRGGRCRHCGHLFRAQPQGDSDQELSLSSYYCLPLEAGATGTSDPMLSSSTITALAPGDENDPRDAPRPEPFRGLASVCRRLVARAGEQAARLRPLDPRPWLVRLRSRTPWLRGPDDPGPPPGRGSVELEQDREAARAAADDWRSLFGAIREQAVEANRLKQELRADLAEVERMRVQLKDAYPLAIDPNSRAALEKIQELETLRADCERLREEARVLRSQLELRATEAQERCDHLTEERDSARAERDRWEAAHASIERELGQARDLLGAGHDALAWEVDQLQARLGELERSQQEAACQHERERASWETRRKELEEGWELQRHALLEAEDRLSQQQAGFEAERQFWRRQLDEHAQRVEQLRSDVVISEQLRAAIEAERDEARTARRGLEGSHQAERDRLVAALERAREAAEAAATALQPRPQACSFHDPEAFRTHLEQWLAEARARLEGLGANPDRPANQALSRWLEYEIRTARDEIALLDREPVPDPGDTVEDPGAVPQPALIMDASHGPGPHGD